MARRSMRSRAESDYPTGTEANATFITRRIPYGDLAVEGIERPILVGHPMGTQVVSQLVFDHPATTDRIVVLAPTMDPDARGFWHATGRLLLGMLTREPPAVNAIERVS